MRHSLHGLGGLFILGVFIDRFSRRESPGRLPILSDQIYVIHLIEALLLLLPVLIQLFEAPIEVLELLHLAYLVFVLLLEVESASQIGVVLLRVHRRQIYSQIVVRNRVRPSRAFGRLSTVVTLRELVDQLDSLLKLYFRSLNGRVWCLR